MIKNNLLFLLYYFNRKNQPQIPQICLPATIEKKKTLHRAPFLIFLQFTLYHICNRNFKELFQIFQHLPSHSALSSSSFIFRLRRHMHWRTYLYMHHAVRKPLVVRLHNGKHHFPEQKPRRPKRHMPKLPLILNIDKSWLIKYNLGKEISSVGFYGGFLFHHSAKMQSLAECVRNKPHLALSP